MDPESAIEERIEPTLLEAFGRSQARSMLAMATLAYVTAGGGKIRRYRAFLDSLCSNESLLREWGPERAARQCQEWKDLVPLEPQSVVVLANAGS
jgi:hypothetical protein